MVDPLIAQLEAMLRADVAAMRREERNVYVKLTRERAGDIVLFGAGGLGRRILAGLRANGVEPLAFADNSPRLQGTTVDGLRVLSAEDAAAEFGDEAVFIVTIWGANSPHRFAHTRDQLAALGCMVMIFPPICWKYAESLLPHYLQDLPSKVLEQKDDVRRVYDLWADDASRNEYVAQVRFRVQADFDGLPSPVRHPQYFPPDLVEWRDDEWIVDGGAYNGDSLRSWMSLRGTSFGYWLAIEPDPANATAFREMTAALSTAVQSRIELNALALSDKPGSLHIETTGTASSAAQSAGGTGTIEVPAYPLDGLVGDGVSFIKLDIEGGELAALDGMRETVRTKAPILAICAYHRQDHLWKVPLAIRAMRDDYRLYLRPHNEEGWDLVCYAIPPHRSRR